MSAIVLAVLLSALIGMLPLLLRARIERQRRARASVRRMPVDNNRSHTRQRRGELRRQIRHRAT